MEGEEALPLPGDDCSEADLRRLDESIRVVDDLRELSTLLVAGPAPPLAEESPDELNPLRGQLLGRYELVRALGEGGTSTVYLASDPELDRLVAIKELRAPLELEATRNNWVQTEARSLARVRSEAVLKVLDVGESDGKSFIVTEYIKGPNLRDVIREMRAAHQARGSSTSDDQRVALRADALASIESRIRLVAKLARGLQTCHRERVLHRDIKPENVLLRRSDEPVLIDFGLAHLPGDDGRSHVTQVLVGTPLYLAPEQVEEGRTGARPETDIYALGMLLYELVTLQHPFEGQSRPSALRAIAAGRVPSIRSYNSKLSTDLSNVVARAIEHSPDQRYPSMSAFADDLEALAAGGPVVATRQPILRQLRRSMARHRRELLTATCVAVIGAAALTGWMTIQSERNWSSVRNELDELVLSTPTLNEPGEFERALASFDAVRSKSEALGAQASLPWINSSRTDPEKLSGMLGRRLRDTVTREALEVDPHQAPHRRRKAAERLALRWTRLLTESDLLGINVGLRRDRVRVELPDGARLLRMSNDQRPTLTEWHNPLASPPGHYRIEWDSPTGLQTQDAILIENQLVAKPQWNATPTQLAGLFVKVLRSDGSAFWITKAPITNHEIESNLDLSVVERFNRSRQIATLGEDPRVHRGGDSEPANVPSNFSRRFATAVGCRLPTVEEAMAAESILVGPAGVVQTSMASEVFDASWAFVPERTRFERQRAGHGLIVEDIPMDAFHVNSRLHLVRDSRP